MQGFVSWPGDASDGDPRRVVDDFDRYEVVVSSCPDRALTFVGVPSLHYLVVAESGVA